MEPVRILPTGTAPQRVQLPRAEIGESIAVHWSDVNAIGNPGSARWRVDVHCISPNGDTSLAGSVITTAPATAGTRVRVILTAWIPGACGWILYCTPSSGDCSAGADVSIVVKDCCGALGGVTPNAGQADGIGGGVGLATEVTQLANKGLLTAISGKLPPALGSQAAVASLSVVAAAGGLAVTSATLATEGTLATRASEATLATRASEATLATRATEATLATRASEATLATRASQATVAAISLQLPPAIGPQLPAASLSVVNATGTTIASQLEALNGPYTVSPNIPAGTVGAVQVNAFGALYVVGGNPGPGDAIVPPNFSMHSTSFLHGFGAGGGSWSAMRAGQLGALLATTQILNTLPTAQYNAGGVVLANTNLCTLQLDAAAQLLISPPTIKSKTTSAGDVLAWMSGQLAAASSISVVPASSGAAPTRFSDNGANISVLARAGACDVFQVSCACDTGVVGVVWLMVFDTVAAAVNGATPILQIPMVAASFNTLTESELTSRGVHLALGLGLAISSTFGTLTTSPQTVTLFKMGALTS